VPGVKSGLCSCGNGFKTRRYMLIHRKKEQTQREELRRAGGGGLDFKKLLDTLEGAGVTSRWIIRSGRLPQFSPARSLLYD
jgi:hypothetical protein